MRGKFSNMGMEPWEIFRESAMPCRQLQVLFKAFRGEYGIDEANLSRTLTGKKLKEYAARLYREKEEGGV